MKVLFICPYNPFPPNSGNKTLTFNLIKSLSSDIKIDILIIEDYQEKSLSSQKAYIKSLIPLINNVHIFKKNKSKISFLDKFYLVLKGIHPSLSNYENKNLRKWLLLNCKNYNIIHFDTILTVNYLRFINTEISLLVASDAYSMATKRARLFTSGLYKNLRLILQEFFYKNIEIKLYPKFKKVITVSPIDAEYLKRISPEIDIDDLPIPIGDDFKETTIRHFQFVNNQPEKVKILFVGSLSHPIISSNIVSVIKLLRKSFLFSNNLEMVILGKDPHPIIKYILGKNITHVEYVEDYKKFLDQDWIYIYAQKCASGLQTKLQQAMAMGLPVIARQVSLGGLSTTHNKNILIAKSDSDFEKNVELLIKNPELRIYIGRNARSKILDNFSSEIVKKMYLNTYTKLLNIDLINSF